LVVVVVLDAVVMMKKVVSTLILELGSVGLDQPDLPVTFRAALAFVQTVLLRLDTRGPAEMLDSRVGFCAAF
jgi:hypothetical protein